MTNSRPRRGEIWRVNLDPTRGHEQSGVRPVLVVSDDTFNRSRADLIVVVPLTTKNKGVAWQVDIQPPQGGLTMPSFIKCEDIRSITIERFEGRLGTVEESTLNEVSFRLRALLKL